MCFGSDDAGAQVTTQQTNNAPWDQQQPHLQNIFAGAENAYNSGNPNFYENATYVPFSDQTNQALQMTQDRALNGSALQNAGNQAMQDTVNGNYLNNNPHLQGAIDAASEGVTRNFQDAVSGIHGGASMAGRMGSGAHQDMMSDATYNLAGQLGNISASMSAENYANERQNQMNAAAMAPEYAQSDYNDIQRLAGVGQANEGLAGDMLQDDINRWNFEQESEWNNLARYHGLVNGGYGSSGTSTQSVPLHENRMGNMAGGAMMGYQMGGGYGALAGGLLGAFS